MIKNWFRRRPPARLQVLMVCMGNICRSPIAEAVLRSKLDQAGLGGDVAVDSAGTHGFHRGSAPDPRGVAQAARRGYQVAGLKSRPVEAADFERFDLVLAMDRSNLATLQERCPPAQHHRLHLLLPFADAERPAGPGKAAATDEVPDPYYGSLAGFEVVLDLIEPACDGVVQALQRRLAEPL